MSYVILSLAAVAVGQPHRLGYSSINQRTKTHSEGMLSISVRARMSVLGISSGIQSWTSCCMMLGGTSEVDTPGTYRENTGKTPGTHPEHTQNTPRTHAQTDVSITHSGEHTARRADNTHTDNAQTTRRQHLQIHGHKLRRTITHKHEIRRARRMHI